VGKAEGGVSDDPLERDQVHRSFVRGRNLPTAKSLSVGAAAVLVFLFALRELPGLSYWLHLPIAVFYLLLIGGIVAGFVVRRRWGRLIPHEPSLDIEHMEARAARREAILLLEKSAFRLLPTLAAIGVIVWFFLIQTNLKWVYFAAGFAVIWNVISRPLWDAFVLPLLRRG